MDFRPLEHQATIPDLLARSSERFGSNEFVVTADRRLTIGEAAHASAELAKELLARGVGKGTRVGLLFPQNPDFVIALLAVCRIGALAVPFSTFYRPVEAAKVLRLADVHTLLTVPTILGRDQFRFLEDALPGLAEQRSERILLPIVPHLRAICIAGESIRPWASTLGGRGGLVDDRLLAAVENEVTPADLAVVIHTSGTSAEPKGVVHTHGAQVRHAWIVTQLDRLTDETRTFTNLAFFWVGGLTTTILTHLHCGGAIITLERMDPPVALDVIERERPNRVIGWTLVERLTDDPSFAGRDFDWLPALRSPDERPDQTTRHQSLGMSETCGPHSRAPAAEAAEPLPAELRGSFGRPLPGVEHRIVDPATGLDLEGGVEGEIWVRGFSLMDGLYKRERADVFEPDGWFRTGDHGFLRDGCLFFTGRRGDMIKTKGANVSPREVEVVLESIPGVVVAVVAGISDRVAGQRIAALVGVEPGTDLNGDDIRSRLRKELSSYKVPEHIVVVDYADVPFLPTAKADRRQIVRLLDGTVSVT